MPEVNAKQRLAELYALIPGIETASAKAPRVILAAQLPYAVVFPDPSQLARNGDNMMTEIRTYRVVLFVDVAQFGTAHQPYDKLDPFFSRVRDYFLERPGLDIATDPYVVLDAEFLGDTGFNLEDYPSSANGTSEFIATTFRHRVTQLLPFNYED